MHSNRLLSQRARYNAAADVASAVSAEKRNHQATAIECSHREHATTCLSGLNLNSCVSPPFSRGGLQPVAPFGYNNGMDIGELRENYTRAELNETSLAKDPFAQFELWFKEACDAELSEPNAMCLSTVSPEGQPSSRTVLLKSFDRDGFVFYTNYGSRKAREIDANPRVSLLFPWLGLERQAIVSGQAEKVSTAESLKYFLSRPRGSQIGAWVSRQSSAVTSRSLIEAKLEEMKRKFSGGEVPLPSFWGGYRVRPTTVEFWQGRADRLHDRFRYTRDGNEDWAVERLAP